MTKTAHKTGATARSRIFILDDHPMTRYGLAQLINDQPDLVVAGEADNARDALTAMDSARPDLVLADITMPGKSGLDFIKDLHLQRPGIKVLVMSMHDETIYAERVLRSGARGYIMKDQGGGQLLQAIREVLAGRVFVSEAISASILESLTRTSCDERQFRASSLTDREFEVFQLLGQGLSTREIAQRLSLSTKTVGTHRVHIKEKLGARSGAELTRHAVRWAAAQQLV
jgi:DNA-binding NarL/FixJ family response regulator